jgi:hypothetical protein
MNQQQRHWKSSFMSPSRIDNYIYHRDEEHYYQVEIWDKKPDKIPQWLDVVYYDGCLYLPNLVIGFCPVGNNECSTIAGVREYINYYYRELIHWGLRTLDESHLNKFICNLLKLKPTSRNMLAGIAVHEYIEKQLLGEIPSIFTQNGWEITTADNVNVELSLPFGREQWIEKYFGDIKILGKTDARGVDIIHDIKTTSKINIEKYAESWQWQIYLWMSGLNKFEYNILQIKIDDVANKVTINDYQQLKLYRYQGMDGRVIELLSEYSDYLDRLKPHIDKMKEGTT